MFDEAIIQKIVRVWAADQAHPYRERKQKPALNPRDVRVLIERVFLSSLKREEERPIRVSVILMDRDSIDRDNHQVTLAFNEEIPFTEYSITKLASALDYETTFLLVGPNGQEEYKIWGVAFCGYREDRFEEIPIGMKDFYNLWPPDALIIRAVSAGHLIISRGRGVIGRLVSGEFYTATPDVFYSKAMGKFLIDVIQTHKGFLEFKMSYWHFYRDTLFCLLSGARVRGHGGTIIWLPNNDTGQEIIPKYTFKEPFALEELLCKLLGLAQYKGTSGHEEMASLKANREFLKRIYFLSQLSCTDGALIISDKLNVLSFGSVLNAPEWKGSVKTGPDGFGGITEDIDISKLGTRHNSAINFVGSNPGSIAFVISQDGPIRGLLKYDNKTVLWWPDCLSSMFLE